MKSRHCRLPHAALLLAAAQLLYGSAQAAEQRLLVPPRATNPALDEADPPHLVMYDPAVADDAPLLVWLPGTGGKPATGPQGVFDTVRSQGLRLVGLSYITAPAVSQVCAGPALQRQPNCASQLRQHRVWGAPVTAFIDDRPADAIVPRLVTLLQHLAATDPMGRWQQYLDGSAPRWNRIVLAGQSQGGGMAAFIAQTQRVAGVVMFSGGWDHRPGGDIAAWYGRPSATPPERWHGTFHVQEAQAGTMEQAYRKLGLPPANIHALNEPVQGRTAHGEGIRNPAYRPLWEIMLKPLP